MPPTYTAELVALQNPHTGERVVAMWARDNLTMTVTLTATAPSAVLVYPNGLTQTLIAVNGFYEAKQQYLKSCCLCFQG
jgi:hypothetical protein